MMSNMPVQMDPQAPPEDPNEVMEREDALMAGIRGFATTLTTLLQEQIGKRQELEQRWLEDMRQYHGQYSPEDMAKVVAAGGSQVFVNITRNKTHAYAARLQDMLFPTDDRSWAIQPTPVPAFDQTALARAMSPAGPVPAAAPASDGADAAAEAMQDEIDDQLVESRYQALARDVIDDASMLGTGIIKGPTIVGRVERKWQTMPNGLSVLSVTESLRPAAQHVSLWDFYPDMDAAVIDDAEFTFERHRMTKRRLREFARLPGVLVDEVRELLRAKASTTHLGSDHMSDIRAITGLSTLSGDRGFEIWEYHGPISKAELCACLEAGGQAMAEDEIDELDDEIDAIVFFSGGRVLKVSLNPMDTQDHPYSIFCCEQDHSCIFGFGVPYQMRQAQRVINAAWRMMMDNAGMSVADQVVINREIIEPADGDWKLRPKKQWYLIDKTRSPQEAFATYSTQSHQAELANIFHMARQLADEETNLPLIAQGEQTSNITQTSTGMAMLMNSANIVLRRSVKNWDDDITRPLITRFYDWNMQYSNRPEIKGDFLIDARGSGVLLVREKQQQNLMIYANLSASNPELAALRDWAGLDKEIAKSLEVPYEQITKSDEELAEAMAASSEPPPPDPAMEAKIAEIEVRRESIVANLEDAREKRAMEYELAAARMAQERELKLYEIASRENTTVASLEAKLQIADREDRTRRDQAAARSAIERGRLVLQGQNLSQGYDTF